MGGARSSLIDFFVQSAYRFDAYMGIPEREVAPSFFCLKYNTLYDGWCSEGLD